MKTAVKALFIFALAGFMISCGNSSEANHDHSSSEDTHEHAEGEDTHDHAEGEDTHDHAKAESHSDIGVSLDDGKLWVANPETTSGINNMIKLTKEFSDRESVVGYAELNKNLQNEFGLIFERCTMTGESHNQLHSYLVPMKGYFAGLISSDISTCKTNYDNLAVHLNEYQNYFE